MIVCSDSKSMSFFLNDVNMQDSALQLSNSCFAHFQPFFFKKMLVS